jgi:hypothetical protein
VPKCSSRTMAAPLAPSHHRGGLACCHVALGLWQLPCYHMASVHGDSLGSASPWRRDPMLPHGSRPMMVAMLPCCFGSMVAPLAPSPYRGRLPCCDMASGLWRPLGSTSPQRWAPMLSSVSTPVVTPQLHLTNAGFQAAT